MADFKKAYQLTMKVEGGYANHPNDTGGETWRGIARKKNPSWSGWKTVDENRNNPRFPKVLSEIDELQELVEDFYKIEYWDHLKLDLVNDQRLANELFDTSVNTGQGVAAIFLQRALNVTNRGARDYADLKVDGNIGSKTITAVNSHPRPAELLKVLNTLQGAKYIAIAENNPTQEIFMSSWMSRVFEYSN